MTALMFQGTGSDVGKSILTAGFCRALIHRGLTVRPFKPQNMSNNAAVTADGGEIGRAQALQALACGVAPTVHMNPVLLKPQSDIGAQVVVLGKVQGLGDASYFCSRKSELLDTVVRSFELPKSEADIVVVEGAGSPAEINLRAGEIANMGFARAADVPVVLVGDIDRGGVIASLVGTHTVLDEEDRSQIKGFLVNKFRGDVSLFDEMSQLSISKSMLQMKMMLFYPESLNDSDLIRMSIAGDDGLLEGRTLRRFREDNIALTSVSDIAQQRLNRLRNAWTSQTESVRRRGSIPVSMMHALTRINILYRQFFTSRPEPLQEIEVTAQAKP